jgi:hypothetical protein
MDTAIYARSTSGSEIQSASSTALSSMIAFVPATRWMNLRFYVSSANGWGSPGPADICVGV